MVTIYLTSNPMTVEGSLQSIIVNSQVGWSLLETYIVYDHNTRLQLFALESA